MPDAEFTAKETVARYAKSLDDLPVRDQQERLRILADFAAWVDRDPDRMIEEIFNEETRKYRKRGFYTEKSREFSEILDIPASRQLWARNVIRAFFIANGRRLLPEQPDWMRTP